MEQVGYLVPSMDQVFICAGAFLDTNPLLEGVIDEREVDDYVKALHATSACVRNVPSSHMRDARCMDPSTSSSACSTPPLVCPALPSAPPTPPPAYTPLPPTYATRPPAYTTSTGSGYMTRQRARLVGAQQDVPRQSPAPERERTTRPVRSRPAKPQSQHKTSSIKSVKPFKSNPAQKRERWPCEVCTRPIFGRKHDMERHLKTHGPPESRDYHCEVAGCDFTTIQHSNLVQHLKTHNRTKCIDCGVTGADGKRCPFMCGDSGQMTRHKQKVHGWPNGGRVSSRSSRSSRSTQATPALTASELLTTPYESPLSSPPDSPRQRQAQVKGLMGPDADADVDSLTEDAMALLAANRDITISQEFRMPLGA